MVISTILHFTLGLYINLSIGESKQPSIEKETYSNFNLFDIHVFQKTISIIAHQKKEYTRAARDPLYSYLQHTSLEE